MIPLAHQGGWDEILLFLSVPAIWLLGLWIHRLVQGLRGRNAADSDEPDGS